MKTANQLQGNSFRLLVFFSLIILLLPCTACEDDESSLAIESFSPLSGPPGEEVTILGSNFLIDTEANVVRFNGATATVTAASEGILTVIVPADATTGPITVTTNGKTVTSSDPFTVEN